MTRALNAALDMLLDSKASLSGQTLQVRLWHIRSTGAAPASVYTYLHMVLALPKGFLTKRVASHARGAPTPHLERAENIYESAPHVLCDT